MLLIPTTWLDLLQELLRMLHFGQATPDAIPSPGEDTPAVAHDSLHTQPEVFPHPLQLCLLVYPPCFNST